MTELKSMLMAEVNDWGLANRFADEDLLGHFAWTEAYGWMNLDDEEQPLPTPDVIITTLAGEFLSRAHEAFVREYSRPSKASVRTWEKHFSYRHIKAVAELAKGLCRDEDGSVAARYEKTQSAGAGAR
jgi:hypothetical protein